MRYFKKEIVAILAVAIVVSIVGVDLFASQEDTNKFTKSGAQIISPIGTDSRTRCETPFRSIKTKPQVDLEQNKFNPKNVEQ